MKKAVKVAQISHANRPLSNFLFFLHKLTEASVVLGPQRVKSSEMMSFSFVIRERKFSMIQTLIIRDLFISLPLKASGLASSSPGAGSNYQLIRSFSYACSVIEGCWSRLEVGVLEI